MIAPGIAGPLGYECPLPRTRTSPLSTPTLLVRKARGAYYTPMSIATFLSSWAIGGRTSATVLDPTCGDGVFLQAAGQELRTLGMAEPHLVGVDIDEEALRQTAERLRADDLTATLLRSSFFDVTTGSGGLICPTADAVVGNPPFIRYHGHVGETRAAANKAALAEGVQLSGLASAWAACLVHSARFLRPRGRLGMVLPAELLSVNYAVPVRDWLRRRFGRVGLVTFQRLQFDALANVVLLLAEGEGGTDSVHIVHVRDSSDLEGLDAFASGRCVQIGGEKWSTLLLTDRQAVAHRRGTEDFVHLEAEYGKIELGTVTGANEFFVIAEETRREFGLTEEQVERVSPPGSKHLKRLAFTTADWQQLRDGGSPVWLFRPAPDDKSAAVEAYKRVGEDRDVPDRYKCRIRPQWWRPPRTSPPDFFFTYMSHRFPRLVANDAGVSCLNSMHGLHLMEGAPNFVRYALPLAMLNSLTLVGAELGGRSYGGGVLKLEPRETALLPVPTLRELEDFWKGIECAWPVLNDQLAAGDWDYVVTRVDEVLLRSTMNMSATRTKLLRRAWDKLRDGRLGMAQSQR